MAAAIEACSPDPSLLDRPTSFRSVFPPANLLMVPYCRREETFTIHVLDEVRAATMPRCGLVTEINRPLARVWFCPCADEFVTKAQPREESMRSESHRRL